MKVIRRPLTAEAVQFFHDEVWARTKGLRMDLDTGVSYRWRQEADCPPEPEILSRDGRRAIHDGDWIITYVNGETDVMRPGQFLATFEPVRDAVPPAGRATRPPVKRRAPLKKARRTRGRRR